MGSKDSPPPAPTISIPIIDISPYLRPHSSPELIADLAQSLHTAAHSPGFFQITGHGISLSLRTRLFSQLESFFALPAETKASLHRKLSPAMRGYEAVGDQMLEPGVADRKEGFTIGAEWTPASAAASAADAGGRGTKARFLQGRNQWPPGAACAGFQETMMEYFAAMRGLSRVMFRLMALSLGLEEDWFDEFVHSQDCELYPFYGDAAFFSSFLFFSFFLPAAIKVPVPKRSQGNSRLRLQSPSLSTNNARDGGQNPRDRRAH